MDEATLEYITKNCTEFIGGTMAGAVVGYLSANSSNPQRLVDRPTSSKIIFSTIISFIVDPITILLYPKTTINKEVQGNLGNILGLYVGLGIGKAINHAFNKKNASTRTIDPKILYAPRETSSDDY